MVLVFEDGLEADGAAGRIDLVVHYRQRSFRQRPLAVGRDRDGLERSSALSALDVRQLIFGRGENDGNRLNLSDRDDPGLSRGIDDIADIDLTQADDAGDRRLDVSVIELGLRIVDGSCVSRDLGGELRYAGALGVELLAGGELTQLDEALQVQVDVGEIGLVLLFLGLGRVERRLIGPRIDFGQQVALLDVLAFGKRDLVDLAVDAGTHEDGVEGLNGSKACQVDWKVRLLDG